VKNPGYQISRSFDARLYEAKMANKKVEDACQAIPNNDNLNGKA